ncbi:alpha/beta fold hydrolase [Duganella sp. FT135W]|uniref:Alpha/beta fold hydrolase n=1 Tax=Duganella flavida TaxID=2692175 RepID=A0A6L8K7X7_9BURK|nr:alpha/beta hydrolase [Duganella flavida]MYM22657.1 alpha/beta fold hydrolase [Duganella flavida]
MNTHILSGGTVPTVVFVHGAWEDASCWLEVTARLHLDGVRVVAAQCSLVSLQDDVDAVCRIVSNEDGPVILVGHGWGGTVITVAGEAERVIGLVYIAASAPEVGQSTAESLSGVWPFAYWPLLKRDSGGFLWFPQALMPRWFAPDLPPASAALLAVVQRPIHVDAYDAKVPAASWHQKPTWYLVTEQDRLMPASEQHATSLRIGAQTECVSGGHVPFLSHVTETTAFIRRVMVDCMRSGSWSKIQR